MGASVYKFRINGDHARKQQGVCDVCLRVHIPWSELHEWGMCASCYVDILKDAFKQSLLYEGCSEKEAEEHIWGSIEEVVERYKIKREKAEPGWVPGKEK